MLFSQLSPPLSCNLPNENEKSCYNFVSDYIIYDNLLPEDKIKRDNNLHSNFINFTGDGDTTNNPPFASKSGILFPPSPLAADLSGPYVPKYFIGEYEYGKYINPQGLEEQNPLYEKITDPPVDEADPEIRKNVQKFLPNGSQQPLCHNEWPFESA